MSFRAYLKARPKTTDAGGAFALRAKDDPDLPDTRLWSELETFLLRRNVSDAELEIARRLWGEYRATLRVQQS